MFLGKARSLPYPSGASLREVPVLSANIRQCFKGLPGTNTLIQCLTILAGNAKRGNITVLLTSCSTSFYYSVLQIKTKIVIGHTADSKPDKLEVNSAVILPPLVFPDIGLRLFASGP